MCVFPNTFVFGGETLIASLNLPERSLPISEFRIWHRGLSFSIYPEALLNDYVNHMELPLFTDWP